MRTTGTVKWFDPVKGVGCVVSDGGSQAALSRATLAAAGLRTIAPLTPLTYEVKLAEDGLIVTAIYEAGGEPLSRPTPPAGGRSARIRGRISSFDPAKGYGFITSREVEGDVLLHRSVLEQWGDATAIEGATVECDVIEKICGLQARRIISLSGDGARARRPQGQREEPEGPWRDGACRWFDRAKGFGFVAVPGDIEEALVHIKVLRRCNVRKLHGGQRVKVRVRRTPKGPLVTAIALEPGPDRPPHDD